MFKQYFKNYNEIQDSLLLCNDCKKELLKIVSLDSVNKGKIVL